MFDTAGTKKTQNSIWISNILQASLILSLSIYIYIYVYISDCPPPSPVGTIRYINNYNVTSVLMRICIKCNRNTDWGQSSPWDRLSRKQHLNWVVKDEQEVAIWMGHERVLWEKLVILFILHSFHESLLLACHSLGHLILQEFRFSSLYSLGCLAWCFVYNRCLGNG